MLAREEADKANRAKSRFLATASHDLRQPLQAIHLINASMQKLTASLPDLRELVRHQSLAIDTATRLLNTLLDISRLESGAIEPEADGGQPGVRLWRLSQEFEPAAAAKNLQLEFADAQAVISTDRVLFTQLLQNLIGNALKYTERGFVADLGGDRTATRWCSKSRIRASAYQRENWNGYSTSITRSGLKAPSVWASVSDWPSFARCRGFWAIRSRWPRRWAKGRA